MDHLISTPQRSGWVSTCGIPELERRNFWLNYVHKQVIHVDCPSAGTEGIEASLRHQDLGQLRLNQIRANAHSVQRSQADIACDAKHSVFLCFMMEGQGFSYQGTLCVQHSPGDIILYDTLMPYGHVFPADMDMVVMDLPEPVATQYLPSWKRGNLLHLPRDTRFTDTSADQLFMLMKTMLDQQSGAAPNPALVANLLEHIEVLVSNICSDNRDQDLWRQCQRYILQNLQEETLSTALLAKELNVSTRKLHRTFADNGQSVQSYIWLKRLEQCRTDILTPALANRNVSEIAFKWGFNDAAHFSRRYKARYGESPAQTRHLVRTAS